MTTAAPTAMRAVLVVQVLATLLASAPRPALADIDKAKRLRILKGVVMLVALARRGGRLYPVGRGSGTVISSSGHILTNDHVVANFSTKAPHQAVAVSLTTSFDRTPKPTCLAFPSRAYRAPALDLAVIRCETEVNGRPLRRAIRWPAVELGSSANIIPGDSLYIVGYPAVGGSTISFFAGKVAGFLGDPGAGLRAWIKTDASVSPGVSGGAAFDEQGKLVGVPTRLAWRKGGRTTIGMVRPINRAGQLIRNALAGGLVPPVKPRTAPGVATEPPRAPAPAAKPRVRASFLMGQLVDATSLRPVRGASVVVVKPGVDVRTLRRQTLRRKVYTVGTADSRGYFRTVRPLPHGWIYGVVVLARGYRLVRVNNAVNVRKGAKPLLNLGVLRLQRQRY